MRCCRTTVGNTFFALWFSDNIFVMHRNTLAFVIAAAIGGFIGGFWLANSLNRTALNSLGGQAAQPLSANSTTQSSAETDLSSHELRAKIAEADRNPSNFAFQKDLGIALYRYAAMKQDARLLNEAVRILERGKSINAKDFDLLVALGNGHFDIGFYKKDAASFQTARDTYAEALELKPADSDVRTDLGLTYFLQEPPQYDRAVAELTKVSDANPKHDRSLQFLVQAYVKQGKLPEAGTALAKINAINPSNPAIPELTSQISAAQTGVK